MAIVWTFVACLVVVFLQKAVFPFLGLMTFVPLCLLPANLLARSMMYVDDMDAYAADHPWRVHAAALSFRLAAVLSATLTWALLLAAIWFASSKIDKVNWLWVYAISAIAFLPDLVNAFTLNSQYTSLSHRLRGGSSEIRYRHGARDLSPDEVLGPIRARRRGL